METKANQDSLIIFMKMSEEKEKLDYEIAAEWMGDI